MTHDEYDRSIRVYGVVGDRYDDLTGAPYITAEDERFPRIEATALPAEYTHLWVSWEGEPPAYDRPMTKHSMTGRNAPLVISLSKWHEHDGRAGSLYDMAELRAVEKRVTIKITPW